MPIYWFGWDDDGVVDHFLYAIDDTSQWTETRFFQGSFLFTADTARAGGQYGRWHTFYVKAVDNGGLMSYPDYLTFDARTVAPKTTILSPKCDETRVFCMGALPLGTSVKIVWDGEDPDSRDPSKEPVAYTWRLFNTSLLNPGFGVEDDSLLFNIKCGMIDTSSCWSEPTPQTQITFSNLSSGIFWQFGVRAIDEAGAVEPGLRLNRNVIFFKSMPQFGLPSICLYEGSSAHCYPSDGQVWERQTPAGKPLTFRWEGDASAYGGTISGYLYGVDIEDLSDPTQWDSGTWSAEVTSATIRFDSPGVHYFYVKVRDYADAEMLAIVQLELVEFLFDREILYVDDYYDAIPSDLIHDNFVASVLGCARALSDSIYTFNCWRAGLNNEPREFPMMVYPALSELSRYRLVIWDTDAVQNSLNAGLAGVIQNGILDVYLKGGGRLWIYGFEVIRGSDTEPLQFGYGNVVEPQTFAGRFLKISGIVNRPIIGSYNRGDGFRGATPNRKLSDRIPSLDSLDYSRGGASTLFGIGRVEAVMSAMQDTDLSQRPDTVYFYRANYVTSSYHKKACSFRFDDVYSGSRVFYMGFPIHFFFESKVDSLVCFVTDWMFEGLQSPQQAAAH
jgi:hypothetical protein